MKAISPSLPAVPSARSDVRTESLDADEAFGAVIAAALGASREQIASLPQPSSHSMRSATSSGSHDRAVAAADSRHETARADGVHDDAAGSSTSVSSADDTADDAATAGKAGKPGAGADAARASTTVAQRSASATTMLDKASAALADALAGAPSAGATPVKAAMPTATPLGTGGSAVVPPATGASPVVPALPATSALPTATLASSGVATGDVAQDGSPQSIGPVPEAGPAKGPDVAANSAGAQVAGSATAITATPMQAQQGAQSQQSAQRQQGAQSQQSQQGDQGLQGLQATSFAAAATAGERDSEQHDSSKDDGRPSTQAARTADAPGQSASAFGATMQAGVVAPNAAAVAVTAHTPAPPTPAAVPEQIVQLVAPLRNAGDGNYTLSLQLHPAELGPVTVHVAVNDGVMSISLVPDHAQGRDAMNASLGDLRAQLQAGGVRVGDIDVGIRASLSQQGNQNSSNGSPGQTGQQNQQGQHNLDGHAGSDRQQPQYAQTGYERGHDRALDQSLHPARSPLPGALPGQLSGPAPDDALDVRI